MEPLKGIVPPEQKSVADHIFANAMGNPIVFKTQPTKANMKGNTWGYFGDDFYVKTGDGKTIKIAGTDVT